MKSRMRRTVGIFLFLLIMTMLFSVSVSADMGPKPSVRVTFTGLRDTVCYGTLLSKDDSTGPHSVWDGNEKYAYHTGNYPNAELDPDTWKLFAEYKDPDGYYFLQMAWEIGEGGELAWTYYPPSPFKILLYFPEYDLFMTSGIYEKYAFDSYYTVTLPEGAFTASDSAYGEPSTADVLLTAVRSYDYTGEVISFAARAVITILIEMIIAPMFGFREKKQLWVLIGVNGITQIILNIALNVICYRSGLLALIAAYILFEFIIFVLEAMLYTVLLKRVSSTPPGRALCIGYSLCANLVSFIVGYNLALIFVGLF